MTAETSIQMPGSEASLSAVTRASARIRALRPVPDAGGPHVRLGLLWATFVLITLVASPVVLSLGLAGVGAVAGVQTSRTWPRRVRPHPLGAGLMGLVLPLLALAGPVPMLIGGVFLAGAGFVLARAAGFDARRTVLLGVAVSGAASSLALARGMGFTEALVLFGLVSIYDASAYLVGTGANNAWEGPAAGIAAVGAFSLAVAAIFAGVFDGASPWLLGLAVAVLGPVGPYLASALTGPLSNRTPALRRLDSLIVAGPVWVLLAAIVVGR